MHRICIVEDEQSLRDMISLNLELEGYSVQAFSDGQMAQHIFEQTFHFDLIILDVMLPHMIHLDYQGNTYRRFS